jgi:hypothetical protein
MARDSDRDRDKQKEIVFNIRNWLSLEPTESTYKTQNVQDHVFLECKVSF